MKTYLSLYFLCFYFSGLCHGAGVELWNSGDKNLRQAPVPASHSLNLSMARNEFEISFFKLPQVSTKGTLLPLTEMEMKWDKKNPGITWSVSALGIQHLMLSSYLKGVAGDVPEIVIPMSLLNQKEFTIPKTNIPVNPWYLMEVFTPPGTVAGEYTGKFSFKLQNEKYEFPVKLKVYSLGLPQRFNLLNTVGFAPWPVLKKHYGEWHKDETILYQKYFDLAGEHRVDLHKIYYRFPALNKTSMNDLLQFSDGHESFYQTWSNLYQGRDSSRAFKWGVTDLPVPEEFKLAVDDKALAYWKALNLSVKKNDLSDKTYVYYLDEPKRELYPKMKVALTKIKQVAPDLKFLITNHYDKILDGLVDIWCVNYAQWEKPGFPKRSFYQDRANTKKEELWFYTGCNAHGCDGTENHHEPDFSIDRATGYLRSFPWLAYFYNAKGILYYDSVYGYTKEGDSPWNDVFSFTGYGEGNLFYPCNAQFCGIKDQIPLASVRLKILRDGLEDAQILHELEIRKINVKEKLKKFLQPPRGFLEKASEYNQMKISFLEQVEPVLTKK